MKTGHEAGSIRCVLLISDDPTTVNQLTESLQQLGISIEIYVDATSALHILSQRTFEAVIIDFRLGKQSRNLVEQVRISASNRNTLLLATANDNDEAGLAFNLGARFVLERPLSLSSISLTLKAAYGLIAGERRRYLRFAIAVPASIRKGSAPELRCLIKSISEGGLGISTSAALRPGEQFQVRFALPGQGIEITAASEVCWCDTQGQAGLLFVSLSSQPLSALKEWLSRRLRDSLPGSLNVQPGKIEEP